MSQRNGIVSFWIWGYIGEIKTELQAPVTQLTILFYFNVVLFG